MVKPITDFFYILLILKCFVFYTGKAEISDESNNGGKLDLTKVVDSAEVNNTDSTDNNDYGVTTIPLDKDNNINENSGFSFDDMEMAKFKIWPKGVVPYYIDDFSYDKIVRDKIRKFLNEVTWRTGVRFVELVQLPSSDDIRYVLFINRRSQLECSDYTTDNFTTKGVQVVVLGYDCINDQQMAALLLSLLSIPPQHNAPNRDEKIFIARHQILPDKIDLFTRLKNQDWLFHDLPYDFASAGHYDIYKYTKNGGATIIPLDQDQSIEPFAGLSALDVKKIKMMYTYIMMYQPSDNVPECSKLYRPGPGFGTHISMIPKKTKPLNKPLKYFDTNNTNENNKAAKLDEDYHYDDTNFNKKLNKIKVNNDKNNTKTINFVDYDNSDVNKLKDVDGGGLGFSDMHTNPNTTISFRARNNSKLRKVSKAPYGRNRPISPKQKTKSEKGTNSKKKAGRIGAKLSKRSKSAVKKPKDN